MNDSATGSPILDATVWLSVWGSVFNAREIAKYHRRIFLGGAGEASSDRLLTRCLKCSAVASSYVLVPLHHRPAPTALRPEGGHTRAQVFSCEADLGIPSGSVCLKTLEIKHVEV